MTNVNPWVKNEGHEPLLGWALVEVKLRNGQKLNGQIRMFDWALSSEHQRVQADIIKWRRYHAR